MTDDIKSRSRVKKKLREVKFNYLSREFEDKLSRCPQNCRFNQRFKTRRIYVNGERQNATVLSDLDVKNRAGYPGEIELGEEVEIGLCMYGSNNPEEWPGLICDDRETAESCAWFDCKYDKESIRDNFNSELESDINVAHNFKDIAALQWVLDEKAYKWDFSPAQRVSLWFQYHWNRISLWFSGLR